MMAVGIIHRRGVPVAPGRRNRQPEIIFAGTPRHGRRREALPRTADAAQQAQAQQGREEEPGMGDGIERLGPEGGVARAFATGGEEGTFG